MRQRFVQFSRSAIELFQKFGSCQWLPRAGFGAMFSFALVVLRCRIFIALRRTVACAFTQRSSLTGGPYPTTALNCVVRYSNFGGPMSALGQKQTLGGSGHVRFTPKSGHGSARS